MGAVHLAVPVHKVKGCVGVAAKVSAGGVDTPDSAEQEQKLFGITGCKKAVNADGGDDSEEKSGKGQKAEGELDASGQPQQKGRVLNPIPGEIDAGGIHAENAKGQAAFSQTQVELGKPLVFPETDGQKEEASN